MSHRAAAVLCVLAGLWLAGCERAQDPQAAAPASAKPEKLVVAPGAGAVDSPTLKAVRERGRIVCGVQDSLPGFATRDGRGWRGFDVDLCRAVAAAVFGEARRVTLAPQVGRSGFAALQAGDIDMLASHSAWTYARDASLGLDFVGVAYFDSQGFMMPRNRSRRTLAELRGARICVEEASSAEQNLVEHFRTAEIAISTVKFETAALARSAYERGECEALSDSLSVLAANRTAMADPEGHVILPDVISKEPLGPVVRQGDDQWADIVRWSLNAMIIGEELGLSSRTVEAARRRPPSPEVERLLAGDGYGKYLGLEDDWAFEIIRQVGSYADVFDRNLGLGTPIGMERGLNALWNAETPGLLYAPPMR